MQQLGRDQAATVLCFAYWVGIIRCHDHAATAIRGPFTEIIFCTQHPSGSALIRKLDASRLLREELPTNCPYGLATSPSFVFKSHLRLGPFAHRARRRTRNIRVERLMIFASSCISNNGSLSTWPSWHPSAHCGDHFRPSTLLVRHFLPRHEIEPQTRFDTGVSICENVPTAIHMISNYIPRRLPAKKDSHQRSGILRYWRR